MEHPHPRRQEPGAAVEFQAPDVLGFLHPGSGPHGLVLAHGAGADCRSPLLVAASQAFAAAGITTLRCNLPFRQARPTGPPPPGAAARDRAGLLAAVHALASRLPGSIFLGGHSYGGRQASLLASEQPGVTPALLLLSYPLHPPRQPHQLRTAHFPRLHTPALFVHGLRDPFGTPEELQVAITLIPAPARLLLLPGGHELRGFPAAAQQVTSAFRSLTNI